MSDLYKDIDWQILPIKICCDILDHKRIPVSTEERVKRKGEIPYYGANGQQGLINAYIFNEDLILIAEDGGNFDDYQTKSIAYRVSGESWVNNHAHVLRAKTEFDQSFLFHSIEHKDIRYFIRGGTRSKLNKNELLEIVIHFPKLKIEQQAIATILDTIDEAIRRTEAVLAKLRQVKEGMLHDLLNCGLDENGELRDPLRHPEQFKDSEFGEIPKDWSVVTIGMLAFFQNGYCFKSQNWEKSGLPIIRIQNLNQNNEFNYHRGPIQEEWHIFPGDLLFAWAGQRKSSFGPRIWNGPEAVLNQHIFKVVPQEHLVSKQFLNILLNVNLSRIEDCAHGFKQSFLHVPKCDLVGVKVCLPKIDEQDRIENILTCYDNKIESNSASLSKLLRLKQGLLHDLLTGHVRIPPHLLEAMS